MIWAWVGLDPIAASSRHQPHVPGLPMAADASKRRTVFRGSGDAPNRQSFAPPFPPPSAQ